MTHPTAPVQPAAVPTAAAPAGQPHIVYRVVRFIIVGRAKNKEAEPKNLLRELFETIVFVVVLVLLLQRFVAEAFVIPTGSMAETLYGDHVTVKCRSCSHTFPINASSSSGLPPAGFHTYTCPNCGFEHVAKVDPAQPSGYRSEDLEEISSIWSGDRVLVLKPAYHIASPKRFDVPVFKWPVEPFSPRERIPINYIKRLIGLPGETIAVHDGDLYTHKGLNYPDRVLPENPNDHWRYENMYPSDPAAIAAFSRGDFKMVRKSPSEILEQMVPVFDMNHLPKDQKGLAKTRWLPDATAPLQVEDGSLKTDGKEFVWGWATYQHLKGGWRESPNLEPIHIVNRLGYNQRNYDLERYENFTVSDLIVECRYQVNGPNAMLALELNKRDVAYRMVLQAGVCLISKVFERNGKTDSELIERVPVDHVKDNGTYDVRFANVDCKLTVWINGKVIPFSEKAEYAPTLHRREKFEQDRLKPARLGLSGPAEVTRLKLSRDLYYISGGDQPSAHSGTRDQAEYFPKSVPPSSDVQTFYVQPGHFLCFGDNSTYSLDGRMWGLVPERLLLGKAVTVYFPPKRFGVIK
jgi:signal peptidase I